MRIRANTMRFGKLMWEGTGSDKAGQRWRKDAKRFATRKDRANSKRIIAEG